MTIAPRGVGEIFPYHDGYGHWPAADAMGLTAGLGTVVPYEILAKQVLSKRPPEWGAIARARARCGKWALKRRTTGRTLKRAKINARSAARSHETIKTDTAASRNRFYTRRLLERTK